MKFKQRLYLMSVVFHKSIADCYCYFSNPQKICHTRGVFFTENQDLQNHDYDVTKMWFCRVQ